MIRGMFQKAADAFVDASQLRKQVNELRTAMEGVLLDIETVKGRSKWLEEQLNSVTGERDTLRVERDESRKAHESEKDAHGHTQWLYNALVSEHETVKGHRDSLQSAYDAEVTAHDATKRDLAAAQIKIDEVRRKAEELVSVFNQRIENIKQSFDDRLMNILLVLQEAKPEAGGWPQNEWPQAAAQ